MKNLQELTIEEQKNIDGGKVPFWLFIVSPIPAYLISKFEDGCECNVIN